MFKLLHSTCTDIRFFCMTHGLTDRQTDRPNHLGLLSHTYDYLLPSQPSPMCAYMFFQICACAHFLVMCTYVYFECMHV